MNIFFIPSWYPYEENPVFGIFVKEQIIALAEFCDKCNLAVFLWGQGRFELTKKNRLRISR